MEENINALDEISKGANMGMDAINFIIEKTEDNDLKKEIETEYQEYEKISQEIEKIYYKYNDKDPHKTSAMNKAMTWSGIEMRTLNDNSTSKLAELLIQGVNMGIIEGRKIINKKKMNKEVEKIVKKYVTMQEKNLDNLKAFL